MRRLALLSIAMGGLAAIVGAVAFSAADAAPSSSAPKTSASRRSPTSSPSRRFGLGSGVATWPGSTVSPTAIPIGDHKVSSVPRVGDTDSCVTSFRSAPGRDNRPWIDASTDTWNMNEKIHVEGKHTWPAAEHSFTVRGSNRILQTNDLPKGKGQTTGTFPISPSDPAYQYDRNPNSIAAQDFTWTVPAEPTAAAAPACVPMGPIGVATNGVVLFNALDASGRDAGVHEVQDSCDGHPQSSEIYHYHDFSACLDTAATEKPGSSTLVGYALDGYGIYVERDSHGNLPTNADLDACHGRTSTVLFNGKEQVIYHYDVTLEYPYFVGCFRGTPHTDSSTGTLHNRAPGQNGAGPSVPRRASAPPAPGAAP